MDCWLSTRPSLLRCLVTSLPRWFVALLVGCLVGWLPRWLARLDGWIDRRSTGERVAAAGPPEGDQRPPTADSSIFATACSLPGPFRTGCEKQSTSCWFHDLFHFGLTCTDAALKTPGSIRRAGCYGDPMSRFLSSNARQPTGGTPPGGRLLVFARSRRGVDRLTRVHWAAVCSPCPGTRSSTRRQEEDP